MPKVSNISAALGNVTPGAPSNGHRGEEDRHEPILSPRQPVPRMAVTCNRTARFGVHGADVRLEDVSSAGHTARTGGREPEVLLFAFAVLANHLDGRDLAEDAVWKRPRSGNCCRRSASALLIVTVDEHLYDVDFRSATCRPRRVAVSDTAGPGGDRTVRKPDLVDTLGICLWAKTGSLYCWKY